MTVNDNSGVLQALVDKIVGSLAGDISVLVLSELSGLSPWHFQRWFKCRLGFPTVGFHGGEVGAARSLIIVIPF